MAFINNLLNFFSSNDNNIQTEVTDRTYWNDVILPTLIETNKWNGDPTAISSCYTAVKILGETLSRLPLFIYLNNEDGRIKQPDHNLYDILHYNPNNYLTSQSFFNTMEVHRNLKGNAYAKIHRNKNTGRVKSLEIIPPSRVLGYKIENGELYYKLKTSDENKVDIIHCMDILHFRHMSKDGIMGLNPVEALRLNLSMTNKGLKTIDSFYENNANTSKAIKSTISGVNQTKMIEAIEQFKKEYSGSVNAGKLLPLPPNTELQDVTMSFVDAQFISTIKFNSDQISALFGLPSHLLGNYESSKFNNVEQLQLNFKVNTMAAILRMYRQEMEFKLLSQKERKSGLSIEFNSDAMVETDYKTRIDGYGKLQGTGAITPNDIAKKEGYKTFKNGDKHYMFNQYVALEDITKPNNIDE